MKQKIVTLLTCLMILGTLLCGCSRKGVCDGCAQTESLNKFKMSNGDIYYYCDYCYNMAKFLY